MITLLWYFELWMMDLSWKPEQCYGILEAYVLFGANSFFGTNDCLVTFPCNLLIRQETHLIRNLVLHINCYE